jgi:SAM-dependent methyltransferase
MRVQPYNSDFFLEQRDGSLEAAEDIVPYLMSLIKPVSVLDVGCGVGGWLSVFMNHGVQDCYGIDGDYIERSLLSIDESKFLAADLAGPVDLGRQFDLVISLEVAEHLLPASADLFIANLTRHGDIILFSAAVPGQGGTHHTNEQWPEYWKERFQERDYVLIDCLRDRFWFDRRIPCCYRQNMMLYVRRAKIFTRPELLREQEKYADHVLGLVHPEVFAEVINRNPSLRAILRALPDAIRTTMKARSTRIAHSFERFRRNSKLG